MNKYEYAQLFTAMGVAVIPLRHRGKEPASHMMGGSWEKYKQLIPTEYEVRNWLWSGWQNYGVVAGHNSLAILDFDDMTAFTLWRDYFEAVIKQHHVIELLADPFMVKSARGVHVYITLPTGSYNNQKRQGVDVKAHGYVVGPACTHPSGAVYEPLNHTFYFPAVWDLETILPSEMFPMTAAQEIEVPEIEMTFTMQSPTEYLTSDPMDTASGFVTGLDLISKIKQIVRIESFFPDKHKSSADGRWYAVCCPFHKDKNPSAHINVFGGWFACEVCRMKPMDVINLYSRMKRISNADAVTELGRLVGVVA